MCVCVCVCRMCTCSIGFVALLTHCIHVPFVFSEDDVRAADTRARELQKKMVTDQASVDIQARTFDSADQGDTPQSIA